MHALFVGAYWGARKERRDECAARCAEFIGRIGRQAGLSAWYKKGGSVKAARSPQALDAESVQAAFRSNDRDFGDGAIPELGFSFSAWNGDAAEPAALAVTCGAYSKAVKNCIVLDLPPVDEVGPIELARLHEILSASIEVWTPDTAIATSMERMMQRGGVAPWTSKGWFNYERRRGITQGCWSVGHDLGAGPIARRLHLPGAVPAHRGARPA